MQWIARVAHCIAITQLDDRLDRLIDRCLFQTHKIGTAYICRSIHIELQHFNTRQ